MYENFAAHNQIHPWAITMEDPEQDDLVDIQLKIYQETGMDTNLLFGTLSECDQFWCAAMPRNRKDYPNEDISPEAHPELFKERIADHAKKVVRALDDVERRFGHRKVYCAGIDEAGPGTVRREIPFINTLLANGGKPWIDMCQAKWTSHFVAQNDTPASINRSNAMQWHEGGAEVTTYAAPFTGPANPVAWRRSKGLRLYLSNYDGINEYQFCGGYDIWNEFTTSDRYGVFSIAFYSLDGVIDTVEWEALREGFDDIRYMTLLRRLAREAMRSKNDKARRMGRLFTAWADTIDAESCDLDEIRVEAAKRIVELQKCLKELSLPTAHLSNY